MSTKKKKEGGGGEEETTRKKIPEVTSHCVSSVPVDYQSIMLTEENQGTVHPASYRTINF